MHRVMCHLFCLSIGLSSAHGEDKLQTLSVTAVDSSGKPVQDLRAADFQVSIGGDAKKVAFSRFDGGKALHSATALLLDLLNDRTMSNQEIVDTTIDAIKGLQTDDDLYLYILSARGQLMPIHTPPRLAADAPPADLAWPGNAESRLRDAFKAAFSMRSQGDDNVVKRLSITSQAMLELAHDLKAIPGRKNLVWVSHGVPLCGFSRQDDVVQLTYQLRRVCEELSQSQISVYPVMQSERGAAGAGAGSVLEMEEVANLTGGRKFGSGYVREAVRQAVADSRATYRLAYWAPEKKPDSNYYKIRVSTVRPNVRVSSKTGFYRVPALTEPARSAQNRLESAARGPFETATIRVLGSVVRLAGSPQNARLDFVVDPDDLFLHENREVLTGRIALWFTTFDSKEWNQPTSTGPIDLRLNPEEYGLAKQNGIAFHQSLVVDAAATKVRAVVVDRELGSIGTLTLTLDR